MSKEPDKNETILGSAAVRAIREEIRSGFMWGVDDARTDVPPFDLEAEKIILSCWLWHGEIPHGLRPRDLFVPIHQEIAKLLVNMQPSATPEARLEAVERHLERYPTVARDWAAYVGREVAIMIGRPLDVYVQRVKVSAIRRRAAEHASKARVLLMREGPIEEAANELRRALAELVPQSNPSKGLR